MTVARTWLGIYMAGFAVLTGFLGVTLFTQAPFGDMTRVARVSEDAFGWHLAPPLIADEDVRSAPLDQADVLVIGDSFSMFFAWQASLVKAGYRVTTTHWDRIGTLCDDLGPWLRQAGFKGKLVVIESIERLLPERIEKARTCRSMQRTRFVTMPPPPQSPAQPAPGFAINWSGQLFSGYITYRNTRAIRDTAGELVVSSENYGDMVFSSPVPDGCRQFSHRLCDKGLFLITDRTNTEPTAADADFMQRFAQQAAPLAVSWMVIPNKTTVYLEPAHARAFVQRARQLGIGPDLFSLAQEVRHQMTDLYWPNDGHWSMHGQLYFGDKMAALTRTLIGAPAADAR